LKCQLSNRKNIAVKARFNCFWESSLKRFNRTTISARDQVFKRFLDYKKRLVLLWLWYKSQEWFFSSKVPLFTLIHFLPIKFTAFCRITVLLKKTYWHGRFKTINLGTEKCLLIQPLKILLGSRSLGEKQIVFVCKNIFSSVISKKVYLT